MIKSTRWAMMAMPLLPILGLAASGTTGKVAVCNNLAEDLNSLQFLGPGTSVSPADANRLKPGACASWTGTPNGAYAIHYILGTGDRVMLCSVEAKVSGNTRIEISSRTAARCLR